MIPAAATPNLSSMSAKAETPSSSSLDADRSDDRSVTASNASDQEMEWVAEDWRVSFMQHENHAIVHMAFMQGWLGTGARSDRLWKFVGIHALSGPHII